MLSPEWILGGRNCLANPDLERAVGESPPCHRTFSWRCIAASSFPYQNLAPGSLLCHDAAALHGGRGLPGQAASLTSLVSSWVRIRHVHKGVCALWWSWGVFPLQPVQAGRVLR